MAEEADIDTKMVNNAKPRVMFDTNTYRFIIDGVADNHGNSTETYQQIRQMISDGKIDAFLSETLFTIEALRKKDRLSFMAAYKPKISTQEEVKGSVVNLTFTMGPSDDQMADFKDTEPLGDYYKRAVSLGFKIIHLPRIAGITNAEISQESLYKVEDFDSYYKLACEVGDRIEERGGGAAFVEELLLPYSNRRDKMKALFDEVNSLPANERTRKIKEVAEAFAEMSDGDSVASSIGLGCCAFCTNDNAKNAGNKSVLSDENVIWLAVDYGFKKLNPTALVELLKHGIL